jgi:hypothetical protein
MPSLKVEDVTSGGKFGKFFFIRSSDLSTQLRRPVVDGERLMLRNTRTGLQGLAMLWQESGAREGLLRGRWDGAPVASGIGDWQVNDDILCLGDHCSASHHYIEEFVHNGSRAIGTVYLLPQQHLPWGSVALAHARGSLQQVKSSQEAVYRLLCELNVQHVFVEGAELMLLQTLDTMSDAGHALWRRLADAFSGYSHRVRMSEEQRELVAELRAPVVYAALRSNITLYPADDLELLEAQAESLQAVRASSSIAGIRAYASSETARELQVKAAVERVLAARPGAEVAVVYGAMHYFVGMENWTDGPEVRRYHCSGFNPEADRLRHIHAELVRNVA